MTDQAPNIDIKPGGGRLVYDKERRTIVSLPMASDCARSEARYITDAAKRVAEQLTLIEAAAQDGQRRIRETEGYIKDLDRHGSIDHGAAQEILKRLLRPDEFFETPKRS